MFSTERDASKVALNHLCEHLVRLGFHMIDCQMATSHLASLGAREVPRAEFLTEVTDLIHRRAVAAAWVIEKDLLVTL
jgi:leucyl/phenylalanyl-tRNA--protein transferase